MDRDIEAPVQIESLALLTGSHSDMGRRSSSCRRRLLFFGCVLLHLGCLGYNLYLIWLLAYLKDNPYYWFLSFIPFFLNLLPLLGLLANFKLYVNDEIPADEVRLNLVRPSLCVIANLMVCFTMLTRLAYYHRQPDEFIGSRLIIMSLQGSIVLIVLDCLLQREFRVRNLLNFKETLTRMLLDFVDIFNMVEILSANECVGLGSFVSEESSIEKAIQAFCTLSFFIVWAAEAGFDHEVSIGSIDGQGAYDTNTCTCASEKMLFVLVHHYSFLFQNVPFLVIRIVVWARYRFYNLGFLVKNVFAIIVYFVCVQGNRDAM